MSSQALETAGLGKVYGQITALDDVTLSVNEGEAFGLLGPNGAGKSTLVKVLMTLMAPTRGTARVFGLDVTNQSYEVRKLVGYVPQDVSVDKWQTPRQILRMLGTFYHVPRSSLESMIGEALSVVELDDRADDQTKTFSGGMKRRLDIATALLHKPRMLVLDEPTLGLDVKTRRRIWDYIKRLKEERMTVLVTTNYLDELEELADRIAILDRGEVKAMGTLDELKSSLGRELVRVEFEAFKASCGCDFAGIAEPLRQVASDGTLDVDPARRSVTFRVGDGVGSLSLVTDLIRREGLADAVKSVALTKPSLEQVFGQYTGETVEEPQACGSGCH
ncbi:MAG: ATP-binding cassette domain-containing protein [Nitrososphaerota archaeon]|nr:ATP-binding cassette domain-containing protein [Nitrososphaerota archaeon]